MKRAALIGIIAAVVLAVALAGCIRVKGGGGPVVAPAGRPTLAEELKDLKKAREKGILTKAEYEECKKSLIASYKED